MPTFTFHLIDPSHGVQIAKRLLPDRPEAQCEASRLLGSALQQFPEIIFHAGALRLEARDAAGVLLFDIEAVVRDRALSR